jgi:hypothetical protein
MTTRSILQRLSTLYGIWGEITDRDKKRFPMPWDNFRQEVRESIANIIVSHKANKKVRGRLHEDTFYGKIYNPDHTERQTADGMPYYVKRDDLEKLSADQIRKIVDPAIKQVILDRLRAMGVDTNKKKITLPDNAFAEPLYLISKKDPKIRTQIKSVRYLVPAINMRNIRGYNCWVKPGNNHHISIYRREDGKLDAEVVTLFEASQRKRNEEPVVKKDFGPECEFQFSLQKNEMVILGGIPAGFNPNDKFTYNQIFDQIYFIRKFDVNKGIVFHKHYVSSNVSKNEVEFKRNPSRLSNCQKIKVSPTGTIEYAYD